MRKIEDIKKTIISTLDRIAYDQDITCALKEFVETYDGTNLAEFKEIMIHVSLLLMQLEKTVAKAEAFDKLAEQNENFKVAANKIKSDYYVLSSGQDIEESPQVDN
jgi:hypothetical protein